MNGRCRYRHSRNNESGGVNKFNIANIEKVAEDSQKIMVTKEVAVDIENVDRENNLSTIAEDIKRLPAARQVVA